jgi:nicotinamide phosphoribosyltransferase
MSNNPTAPLFYTDAYKLDHRRQYPEGTTGVYSNYTNRGSRIPEIDHVVHFGLQAFLQKFMMDAFVPFFEANEDEVAEEYARKVNAILGPNEVGNDHIRALHRKGFLPLRFCAVPEGTLVPLRVPSFTIESTHDDFFWLVNYVETIVSASVWQASTSATLAYHFRQILDNGAKLTSSTPEAVNFQGHDFSFRGLSSLETAQASGAGHLLSFSGTDTLAALDWINQYYAGENGVIGGSVPATEHSVMCAGGQEDEEYTFKRLLKLYPSGILSIVSDTWDFFDVINRDGILDRLREDILARDGKLVIRPDSGDPADIICGTQRTRHAEGIDGAWDTDEEKGAIQLLWERFGGTVNDKGFRELDPHIGLIYGDSITSERARDIIERLAEKGYASTNVVFGVGSFTYQYNTRDTFGSAMKATWVKFEDGTTKNIQKNPKTDNGLKKSATGRLAVLTKRATGELYLVEKAEPWQEENSRLQPVWEDGKFLKYQSFADVRNSLKVSSSVVNAVEV